MGKNYSGSDLSAEFKSFFRKEKKRLLQIFDLFICTNVEISYGFYYFSGFFTADNGQTYYFSSGDVRDGGYNKLLIRTAKNNKDYTGGTNQYIGISDTELIEFFQKHIRK